MRTVALHNLGCKVNAYETEAMQESLNAAGYRIVPFTEKADIYIVNTCSVTSVADKKSRQMLHRAKRKNPDSLVVAMGCYVQSKPEQVRQDPLVDMWIGNNKKNELISMLYVGSHENAGSQVNNEQQLENMGIRHRSNRTRALLKVQDGCNQFCSYCIIPYLRGRARSRDEQEIFAEVERLALSGVKEVVLTGIHLSSYGKDIDKEKRTSLLDLVRAIHKVDGIRRIRLSSLEPGIITHEFVQALSYLPKVCPHFHLSLQSGCDATLKRMNRHYTTAQYRRACELLRSHYEHPAITTDVIVGFPGETQEEFETTRSFLKEIAFYEAHVFKYSIRQGTKAAEMDGQVPEAVKQERSGLLIRDIEKMSEEFVSWYQGKTVEALLEERASLDGQAYMTGHTAEYVKVFVPLSPGEALEESWVEAFTNAFVSGKPIYHSEISQNAQILCLDAKVMKN